MRRTQRKKLQIGTVGIDAGMLYLGDPCYVAKTPLGMTGTDGPGDEHWQAFLAGIASPGKDYMQTWATVRGMLPNGANFRAGMVVETGWGDGEYPVEVTMKEGRIASVTVTFIEED